MSTEKRTISRDEVIDELVNNNVDTIKSSLENNDIEYLDNLLRFGHTGFVQNTDEELEQEYAGIFGEEIQIVD